MIFQIILKPKKKRKKNPHNLEARVCLLAFEMSKQNQVEDQIGNGRYGEAFHGGWDDFELEKRKGNLDTEDGVGSKCTKIIIFFPLTVKSHISTVGV